MLICIGADHRGFKLKNSIIEFLKQEGYETEDLGNSQYDESDDFPDFAILVARRVKEFSASGGSKGILICGTGAGMDMVANKVEGIRSVLGFSTNQVFDSRQGDDVNILSLPADFVDQETAFEIVKVFLRTPFSGELKHKRRIEKISKIELE